MVIQWEYAELQNANEYKNFYLNYSKLMEDGKYPIIRIEDALKIAGLDGWELVMKDKDEYGNKVYRMKRILEWVE